MVAPQNNNLAAAFPLAPRSLHQNLRWSKETTPESYLVRGACGRAQGHAPLAMHGKSGILRQLHFLLAGAAEVPRFIEQGRVVLRTRTALSMAIRSERSNQETAQ